jgi:hypothetical protein
MSRSADYSIQGFLYQFNKTALEILKCHDDELIVVEGVIEDRGGPGRLDRDRVLLSEIFWLTILKREGAEDDEEKAAEPYVGVQGEGGGGGPEGRAHLG